MQSAWKLLSAAAVLLGAALVVLVLAAEGICGLLWLLYGDSAATMPLREITMDRP